VDRKKLSEMQLSVISYQLSVISKKNTRRKRPNIAAKAPRHKEKLATEKKMTRRFFRHGLTRDLHGFNFYHEAHEGHPDEIAEAAPMG
jgi:ankyrin repeat protein